MLRSRKTWAFILTTITALLGDTTANCDDTSQAENQVSYYKQIRPIFQAHCQGCHQPAKSGGDYVMTSFARLLKGGESEDAADDAAGGDPEISTDVEPALDDVAAGGDETPPAAEEAAAPPA